MKKRALLLAALLLLTACAHPDDPAAARTFRSAKDGPFPFYAVATDGSLWRVENGKAVPTGDTGTKDSLKTVTAADGTLSLYTCDGRTAEGKTLVTLKSQRAGEKPETLAQNVVLSLLRFHSDGTALWIDREGRLSYYHDGQVSFVTDHAAQAEFSGSGVFVYRLDTGVYRDGEFAYPVYSATADYKNYRMEALALLTPAGESDLVCAIRDRETVQKRVAAVEIAFGSFFRGDELCCEIPRLMLKGLTEQEDWRILAAAAEGADNTFTLIDLSDGSVLAENVRAGRRLADNLYAYETVSGDESVTVITGTDYRGSIPVDRLLYAGGRLFERKGRTVTDALSGEVWCDKADEIRVTGDRLLCLEKSAGSFRVWDGSRALTEKASSPDVLLADGALYYTVSDSGTVDLFRADGTGETALLSAVDPSIPFLAAGGTVAVVRADGTLCFCDGKEPIDTGLKIVAMASGG